MIYEDRVVTRKSLANTAQWMKHNKIVAGKSFLIQQITVFTKYSDTLASYHPQGVWFMSYETVKKTIDCWKKGPVQIGKLLLFNMLSVCRKKQAFILANLMHDRIVIVEKTCTQFL